MSRKELDRAEVLQRVVDHRLSVTDAAELIGLTLRQTSKLLVTYRTSGTVGLMSRRRGKPLAHYSDRHSIFRTATVATKTGGYRDGMTRFGRALDELDVEPKVRASNIICANSPQAKGRVERANSILQDRLAKELRL